MSLRISNIFQQSQAELQVIYFHEKNYQTDEKPDKTVSKNYLKKLLSARPFPYRHFPIFRQFRTVFRPHSNNKSS